MIPLIDEFRGKLIEDGISPNVALKILRRIMHFCCYTQSPDMKNVTPGDINKYEEYLKKEYITASLERLKGKNVAFKMRSVKTYFDFLVSKGYLDVNPATGLKLPKDGEFDKTYVPTKEEVEALFLTPDEYTHSGIRDRAIMRLLYYCPIMLEEIMELTTEDMTIKDGYVHIKTANGRYDGKVSIDEKTIWALKKYITLSRPALVKKCRVPTNKLFLSCFGQPVGYALFGILKKHWKGKRMTLSTLRIARIVHMVKDGATDDEICSIFGFKYIKSVEPYMLFVKEGLKKYNTVITGDLTK